MIKEQVENKGLVLKTIINPELPTQIHSDYNKIIYTLQNLLFNSVKYTDKGRIEIKFKKSEKYQSKEEQQEYDLYKFIVFDTGKGLDVEAFKGKNDKPFQQGFGLGLYISSQIAYVLSGRYIQVKSEIDSFSKFSFYVRSKKV